MESGYRHASTENAATAYRGNHPIFMVIKCTVDRRAAVAARQRERRNRKAAAKPVPETSEEKTRRIGSLLKQNRRYLRLIARKFNVAHADIKSSIDKVIAWLISTGTEIEDTEAFMTYLYPQILTLRKR